VAHRADEFYWYQLKADTQEGLLWVTIWNRTRLAAETLVETTYQSNFRNTCLALDFPQTIPSRSFSLQCEVIISGGFIVAFTFFTPLCIVYFFILFTLVMMFDCCTLLQAELAECTSTMCVMLCYFLLRLVRPHHVMLLPHWSWFHAHLFQTGAQRYRRGCFEHESGNTLRTSSLRSSWSSQVAVRCLVRRRYPRQQHGGRRNTRVRRQNVHGKWLLFATNFALWRRQPRLEIYLFSMQIRANLNLPLHTES